MLWYRTISRLKGAPENHRPISRPLIEEVGLSCLFHIGRIWHEATSQFGLSVSDGSGGVAGAREKTHDQNDPLGSLAEVDYWRGAFEKWQK